MCKLLAAPVLSSHVAEWITEWASVWSVLDLPSIVRIAFSKRLTRALGRCTPETGSIRLNRKLSKAKPPILRPLVTGTADPGRDANGSLWADKAFGSWHSGVCQFVFCDGSVKALPTSIDINTLQLLGVRNDGLVIPNY